MVGFYHLSVKMISRSDGRSAVACAAYRSGEALEDERYGKLHDYAPRKGITETGMMAPQNAPAWALDRAQLWNRVEVVENRKNSQLAREFTLGLPHQLDAQQRGLMVQTFIAEQLLPRGMVVDYAIHSPNRAGDERNFHAHLMTTLRPFEGDDWAKSKDRDSCAPEVLRHWREEWAELQNRTYERLQVRGDDGRILRADHRSYEEQGIDREATQHMGVTAMAMEREGKQTEIGDKNRAIQISNDNREIHRRQAAEMTHGQARGELAPEQLAAYKRRVERQRPPRGRSDDFDLER